MARSATRNLGRLSEIAQVAVRHGFGYFFERHRLNDLLPWTARVEIDPHERSPRGARLREMLDELGPTFVKFGQLLSTRPDIVPPDIVEELRGLQDDVRPVPFADVRALIEQELGLELEKLFLEFDEQPIAAASIGQVHRAVTRGGVAVAVKVQYPDIAETLAADLAPLELGRFTAPLLWKSLDVGAMVDELKERLTEELDYRIEAANQRDFARWYDGHPFIHVPAVLDELSTRTVLTTTFVDGARFAEFRSWDQRERDLGGEAIFRFVYRSLHDHCAFNGDPHPGNYLFHGGSRVTFLDFGLTKRLSAAARDHELAIVRAAALQPDHAALRRASVAAGYFPADCPLTDEQIAAFVSVLVRHLVDDRPVTITPARASETVRTYLFKGDEFAYVNEWGSIPREAVILQRITVGLLAILGSLNATANWHRVALELLDGAPPTTELGEREADWLTAKRSTTAAP